MSHEPEIDLTNDSDDSGPEVDDIEEKKLLESDDDDDVRPISPPPITKSPPTKKIRVDSIKRDAEKPKEQGSLKTKSISGYTIPKLSSSSSSSTPPPRSEDVFGIQQRVSNVQKKQGTRVSDDEKSIKQNKENHSIQKNNNTPTNNNSNSNSPASFNNSLQTPTTPTNQPRAAPRKSMISCGSRMSISSSPAGTGAPRKLIAKTFIGGGRSIQNGNISIVHKSRVQSDEKSDEENVDDDDGSDSDTSTCSKRSDDSDSTEDPEFAQTMKDIDEETRKAGPRRPQILPNSTDQQAGPEVYYLCDDDEDAYEELMEKLRGSSKGAISADDLYCEHCDKKFNQVNRFIVHHRRHFFIDHFKCTICHRGFINLKLCLIHEIHEHGDDNDRGVKLKPFVNFKKGETLPKMLQNASLAKNKNKMMNGHSNSHELQPSSNSDESSDEEVVNDFYLNGRSLASTSLTVYRGPQNSVKHLSDAFEVELKQQKTGDLGQQIKIKRSYEWGT